MGGWSRPWRKSGGQQVARKQWLLIQSCDVKKRQLNAKTQTLLLAEVGGVGVGGEGLCPASERWGTVPGKQTGYQQMPWEISLTLAASMAGEGMELIHELHRHGRGKISVLTSHHEEKN